MAKTSIPQRIVSHLSEDATYDPTYGPHNAKLETGHYYVSIMDGPQQMLALGPFHCHADALRQVQPVKSYVLDHYVKGCWYAYGTCRLETDTPPDGRLNALFPEVL